MKTGILLVGHGTRDAQGTAEFFALAERLRPHFAEYPLEACLLELQLPDIATGVRSLFSQGIDRLVVAPLLLFAAGHAKEDIPQAVAAAFRESGRLVPLVQAGVLDCHAEIGAISAERCREALNETGAVPDAETALLLIGRGSSDPNSTRALNRFAELRRSLDSAIEIRTGYIAVAEPKAEAAAAALAAEGRFRRIILQPHLLFHGLLMRELRQLQIRLQENFPHIEWLLTDHLAAGIETDSRHVSQLLSAFGNRIAAALRTHAEKSR